MYYQPLCCPYLNKPHLIAKNAENDPESFAKN